MQYSETRKPSHIRQNPDNTQNNLFQKRLTPKETPIKVSSQLVMNQNLMDNNTKPPFKESYCYNVGYADDLDRFIDGEIGFEEIQGCIPLGISIQGAIESVFNVKYHPKEEHDLYEKLCYA